MFSAQQTGNCGQFLAGRPMPIPSTKNPSALLPYCERGVANANGPALGRCRRAPHRPLVVHSTIQQVQLDAIESDLKSGWPQRAIGATFKVLLLGPVLAAVAAGSGGRAVAAPLPPAVTTSRITTMRARAAVSKATTVTTASMSAALSNPLVQVTALLGTLALAAGAATRSAAKRRRAQVAVAAATAEAREAEEAAERLSEPGVVALGLAAMMVDNLAPSKSNGAVANDTSAETGTVKPRVTSLNGRNGPRLVRTLELSKYDIVHELMTKARAASADSKYDPIRWLFDAIGSWQPRETVVRTFLKNVDNLSSEKYDMLQTLLDDLKAAGETSDSKYDPVYELLKGDWKLRMGPLETLARWDPIAALIRVARAPVVFVASKFDFLVSILKGEWQQEISTLDNLPAWDPMSAVVDAAGRPVKFSPNRFDAVEGLLTQGMERPTAQPVWDPITAIKRAANAPVPTLQDVPAWDPLGRVHQTAVSAVEFSPNKYDLVEQILRTARAPVNFVVSKFDVLAVLLHGRWQQQNAHLDKIPSWDPAGKFVDVAKSPGALAQGSKYDPVDYFFGRFVREKGEVARTDVEDDDELPRKTWEHLRGNIAALSKELEAGESNLETIFN